MHCVHINICPEANINFLPWQLCNWFLEAGSLTAPSTHELMKLGVQKALEICLTLLTTLPSPPARVTDDSDHSLLLYTHAGYLKSGPEAFLGGTLPTEPSPQKNLCLFDSILLVDTLICDSPVVGSNYLLRVQLLIQTIVYIQWLLCLLLNSRVPLNLWVPIIYVSKGSIKK